MAAIDLLITDDTNPRSIAFQMQSINELIGQLPTEPSDFALGQDQRLAEDLLHRVRLSQPSVLARGDASGQRPELQKLLHQLMEQLPSLSNAITARYLIHTGATQELTGRAETVHVDQN